MPSRTGSDAANERLRRRYRPAEVRVVFIAESPPAGGTFFYRGNSKLYYATREAFEAAVPALRRHEDFLEAFGQLGCYLDDLSPRPVNHLDITTPNAVKRVARASRRSLAGCVAGHPASRS